MKLLLDTHVFLWWWEGNEKLRADIRKTVESAEVAYVSAVSAWEMAIKSALGKLRFKGPFRQAVAKSGFRELDLAFTAVETLRDLPGVHADPFDRMLVAQARTEGLTLVTADRTLEAYAVPILRV